LVSDAVRLRSFSPLSSAVWRGRSALGFCQNTNGLDAAFPHCTTRLENAHGTEFRELLYPWHPWTGLRVGIHEVIERPDGIAFRCDLNASEASRWLEIPAWMFDRSACAKVRLAAEPHTDLSALVMLVALLWDVRNARSAAPDAPASGVCLSGDRNRREHHATPEQTEVGTPLCAAANRPVLRERADDRRHAGLVRTTDGDPGDADHLDDASDPRSCRQTPGRFDGERS
jgi:hypothetical protein